MQILRRARDEAHRFAVSYHRNRRMKRNLRSLFDGVTGIGEKKRAQALVLLRKLDLAALDETALGKKLKKEIGISEESAHGLAQKIFESLPGQ